ncbi:MAG TPA: DUF2807 domain-containing protein [Rhizomicrobium sp.]|nr:DUF2807 domain-containing protein [Rhizomicrobium sp.]
MRVPSLLIGAAVAALVVIPARAAENNWINGPWRTYEAGSLKLDSSAATVRIDVKDGGPMVLQVSGLADRVNGVKVYTANGKLVVKNAEQNTVWDWKHWFDFSYHSTDPEKLQIHVVVPRGSALDVDAMSGPVNIGNTMGPLKFDVAGSSYSTIGNVSEADLSMAGSGKITVGNVAGAAKANTAGSGDIRIGDVAKMNADIAGSGSISVGRVMGPIDVDIAGSGDFSAASVQGPMKADIAGSGSVTVGGGEANPLRVDIMGSGNVTFGGMAVDPKVDSMGSGTVRVKACRGSGCNDSDLRVGG